MPTRPQPNPAFDANKFGPPQIGIWCVYKCFDSNEVVIYIGKTSATYLARRFGNHRRESYWYASVKRLEVTKFKNKDDAKLAETMMIWRYLPKHNRQFFPMTDGWISGTPEEYWAYRQN